ncbi:MAG: endopeptidase [bacterium]|nr:endopeptidase [bacterium]
MSNSDPTDIAALDRKQAEAAERNHHSAKEEAEDIKWLMSSKRGRKIMHRILSNAGVFRPSYRSNALEMAFLEGNRNQGLALYAIVAEHCPGRHAEMIEEASKA